MGRPEWAYPAMVARWTGRRIESELALTAEMLADLAQLEADSEPQCEAEAEAEAGNGDGDGQP